MSFVHLKIIPGINGE